MPYSNDPLGAPLDSMPTAAAQATGASPRHFAARCAVQDEATAYVVLQEASAIAVVDVAAAEVASIEPLGRKPWAAAGAGGALSDISKEDGTSLQPWNHNGAFMPDAIVSWTARGKARVLRLPVLTRALDCHHEKLTRVERGSRHARLVCRVRACWHGSYKLTLSSCPCSHSTRMQTYLAIANEGDAVEYLVEDIPLGLAEDFSEEADGVDVAPAFPQSLLAFFAPPSAGVEQTPMPDALADEDALIGGTTVAALDGGAGGVVDGEEPVQYEKVGSCTGVDA
jgi:hypothetical protein